MKINPLEFVHAGHVSAWEARHCGLLLFFTLLFSAQSIAVTVTDDFTQPTDNNNWMVMSFNGYPCLTAGVHATSSSVIPACTAISDAAGSGALRLTPAQGNQHGAIVSSFTFPSNQGLQATFTTYSYGGSHDGLASEGADGMSFFLMDGGVPTSVGGGNNLGSWGGSLAYSCSNSNAPYTGLTGAYLGLGMDEYGNYLNSGDNTATGIAVRTSSSSSNGYNSYVSGSYMQANRIGLRGAGNVSWYWLNQNYPWYYPSTLSSSAQQTAVRQTCVTGTLWNNSSSNPQSITAIASSGRTVTVTVPNNGFLTGDSVVLAGAINDVAPVHAISNASNSGATLTVTTTEAHGFANGDSVTLAGVTAGAVAKNITGAAHSGTSKTVTLTVANNGYTNGDSVTIGGAITDANSVAITGRAFVISNKTTNTFDITLSSNPGSVTNTSGTATDTSNQPTIPGAYAVSNVTSNSFQVTLSSTPSTLINSSGTAKLTTPAAVSGSYAIANATQNTFQITLASTPGAITNVSGTAADSSQTGPRNTNSAPSYLDYAVIPGGNWVLPGTQLLADEAHSLRSQAWPITYRLQITPAGYLTFMYSYNGAAYQTVLSNWNMTTANGPLPSVLRFGFAGSTGGSNNVHEITCFAAEPTQSSSSASANTVQAGQIRIGTQEYLASYNPNNWTASLVSKALVNTNGTIGVSGTADWDASCVLTGGGCASMGTDASGSATNSVSVESPASRKLLTWNGTTGVPLEWANLTSAQQTMLNSTDGYGSYRLNWLRGDRSEEQSTSPPGPLRIRAGVLGDIINSSPTWVGPPSMNYGATFTDAHYGAGTESSYVAFKTANATRLNVVYSGSNDGLVHGFRTGANSSDGSYDSTNNDGYEVMGYMPATVLANSAVVDLTNPTYGHDYLVDATPGTGDLYYAGAWHTWLVGALGSGGSGIYALDVTDPSQFSEAHAASLVIGDWKVATLANLGTSTGIPLVRRLHNGQWAILFGNGLGSSNGLAGIYIGLVDATSGAITFKWLSTGAGSTTTPDGINSVASADLDADHVADYLYAGDLLGNVWRFDLTSSNPSDWGVSKYGQPTATPLFVAKDSLGNRQPITTQIAVTGTITGGANRVLLGFGTGQATPVSMSAANTYASGTQTVYGIWDWDMSAWNNGTTTANGVHIPASTTQYAWLSEPTSSPYRTFARSNLYVDTQVTQSGGYATMATATVCWTGSTSCASGNTQYGWLFDLPGLVQGAGEQTIYSPVFSGGELVVNTTTPPTTTLGQCSPVLPTGWTRAFNMASGAGNAQNVFANAAGSFAASTNSSAGISGATASVVGVQQNGVGTPWVISIGSQQFLITQTTTGNAVVIKFQPQGAVTVNRITWEELL